MGFAATGRSVQQQPTAGRDLVRLHQRGVTNRPQQRKLKLLFDIGHAGDIGQPHVAVLQHVEIVFIDDVRAVLDERGRDDVGDFFFGTRPVKAFMGNGFGGPALPADSPVGPP